MTMTSIIQTPWGPAQHRRVITPDLTLISTASHGGIHVSSRAWSRIEAALPCFVPFAGRQWLEEDCDAHVAVALWPAAFDAGTRHATWQFACSGKADGTDTAAALARWMATTPAGRDFFTGCEAWARSKADTWQQGGGWSTRAGRWVSQWTCIGTGAVRTLETSRSPSARFASAAELEEIQRADAMPVSTPIPTGRQLPLWNSTPHHHA